MKYQIAEIALRRICSVNGFSLLLVAGGESNPWRLAASEWASKARAMADEKGETEMWNNSRRNQRSREN